MAAIAVLGPVGPVGPVGMAWDDRLGAGHSGSSGVVGVAS